MEAAEFKMVPIIFNLVISFAAEMLLISTDAKP